MAGKDTTDKRNAKAKTRNDQRDSEGKGKKGFWERYTDRLSNTHCTRTPPECR